MCVTYVCMWVSSGVCTYVLPDVCMCVLPDMCMHVSPGVCMCCLMCMCVLPGVPVMMSTPSSRALLPCLGLVPPISSSHRSWGWVRNCLNRTMKSWVCSARSLDGSRMMAVGLRWAELAAAKSSPVGKAVMLRTGYSGWKTRLALYVTTSSCAGKHRCCDDCCHFVVIVQLMTVIM